jgi:hypothetical protein
MCCLHCCVNGLARIALHFIDVGRCLPALPGRLLLHFAALSVQYACPGILLIMPPPARNAPVLAPAMQALNLKQQ